MKHNKITISVVILVIIVTVYFGWQVFKPINCKLYFNNKVVGTLNAYKSTLTIKTDMDIYVFDMEYAGHDTWIRVGKFKHIILDTDSNTLIVRDRYTGTKEVYNYKGRCD